MDVERVLISALRFIEEQGLFEACKEHRRREMQRHRTAMSQATAGAGVKSDFWGAL